MAEDPTGPMSTEGFNYATDNQHLAISNLPGHSTDAVAAYQTGAFFGNNVHQAQSSLDGHPRQQMFQPPNSAANWNHLAVNGAGSPGFAANPTLNNSNPALQAWGQQAPANAIVSNANFDNSQVYAVGPGSGANAYPPSFHTTGQPSAPAGFVPATQGNVPGPSVAPWPQQQMALPGVPTAYGAQIFQQPFAAQNTGPPPVQQGIAPGAVIRDPKLGQPSQTQTKQKDSIKQKDPSTVAAARRKRLRSPSLDQATSAPYKAQQQAQYARNQPQARTDLNSAILSEILAAHRQTLELLKINMSNRSTTRARLAGPRAAKRPKSALPTHPPLEEDRDRICHEGDVSAAPGDIDLSSAPAATPGYAQADDDDGPDDDDGSDDSGSGYESGGVDEDGEQDVEEEEGP